MSSARSVDSSLEKSGGKYGIEDVRDIAEDVLSEVSRVIIGYGNILHYLFIALLVNGHVLLEGVPGLAKTVTAKTFADALGISFKRIQFTPDLLPSDITGSMVFDQSKTNSLSEKGHYLRTWYWLMKLTVLHRKHKQHCWKRWQKSKLL